MHSNNMDCSENIHGQLKWRVWIKINALKFYRLNEMDVPYSVQSRIRTMCVH